MESKYHVEYWEGTDKKRVEFWGTGCNDEGYAICHRLNGPAFIQYYESGNIENVQYIQYSRFHNLNGPAFISYDEDGNITEYKYFILDKKLTKEQFYDEDFKESFIVANS